MISGKYDTIREFNVDSKAEYSALSSTHSQKKKLKTNNASAPLIKKKTRRLYKAQLNEFSGGGVVPLCKLWKTAGVVIAIGQNDGEVLRGVNPLHTWVMSVGSILAVFSKIRDMTE